MADIVALRRKIERTGGTPQADPEVVGTAALATMVRPAAAQQSTGIDRLLPVLPELRPLLPGGGLRRGATIAVGAGPLIRSTGRGRPAGGTSLLLALLAGASRAGSWCAIVGVPTLGALAAAEAGIDLARLALVPEPGPEWPTVVAALLDGVDVVVAAAPGLVPATVARRLAARARQRGSVLMPYGGRWEGADLLVEAVRGGWRGLGQGRGRLRGRELVISARGRGGAARPVQARIWLPPGAGLSGQGLDSGRAGGGFPGAAQSARGLGSGRAGGFPDGWEAAG